MEFVKKKLFSFEKIIEESITAHAIIGLCGDIIWRNYSFEKLFRFESVDKISIKDICAEPDTVSGVIKALLDGYCDNVKMDKRYCRKDKTLFWGRVSISLVRENEVPIAFFVGIENIDNEHVRKELIAEKINELDTFLKEKIKDKENRTNL